MSTNYNWWSNHTEYYYDAYASDYTNIWRGIESVSGSREELTWLSYYRALTAFLRSDPESIIDRRRLLYYYLKAEFKTDAASDTLNRYRKQLPVDSTVRRVVRNMCAAYDEEPTRRFAEFDGTHELMVSLYQAMRSASALPRIYQRARMTGLVPVRPLYLNGKWTLDYMTPDQFRITTDPDDWRTVTSITYPQASRTSGIEYLTWTADSKITTSYNGVETSEDNPYGRIPWVMLRLGDEDGVYPAGMMELVESQLDNNKIKWLSSVNLTFAGSPVWLALNMGTSQLTLSPDKIISIDGVTAGEGQDIPPQLDVISPEPAYQAIDDFRREREKVMQQNEGIPSSMVSDSGGQPPSGVARLIERQELLEIRYADQKALTEFERELATVVALVAQVDAGVTVGDVDLTINFAEETMYLDPQDEYALDKTKLLDGSTAPEAFYRKWGGLSGTDDELQAEIARRLAFVREAGLTAADFKE